MSDVHIVVLAAGKGTRMKSARPKVLHQVAGAPMIDYVMQAAAALSPRTMTVVVGHQADALKAALDGNPGLNFVVQEPQLGTAHALLRPNRCCAAPQARSSCSPATCRCSRLEPSSAWSSATRPRARRRPW